MDTQAERSHSSYLIAAFAAAYAVIAAELLDINRIPRTFVHRDYLVFEALFVLTLWLCTVGSMRLQTTFSQRSAVASLGWGLASGLVGGLVATIGLLCVSVLVRGTRLTADYLSSWQGVTDFLWAATVISFGWFIGAISGAARFIFVASPKGWLIGFAAFCIVVRAAVLVAHLIRHQPLW